MSTNWSRDAESRVSVPFTHRSIDLRPPDAAPGLARTAEMRIHRRDVLGGLIHEYERVAA
jgi:hypothetical protein